MSKLSQVVYATETRNAQSPRRRHRDTATTTTTYLHHVQHEDPAVAAVVLLRRVPGRGGLCREQPLPRLVSAAHLAHQVLLHGLLVVVETEQGRVVNKDARRAVFGTRQGLFRLLHTNFSVGEQSRAVSQRANRGLLPSSAVNV